MTTRKRKSTRKTARRKTNRRRTTRRRKSASSTRRSTRGRKSTRSTKSRKSTSGRKSTRRATGKRNTTSATASGTFNRRAYWEAYRQLQQRANRAISRLRSDVQRNANAAKIRQDRNNVLVILAECNYMIRECSRMDQRRKRR